MPLVALAVLTVGYDESHRRGPNPHRLQTAVERLCTTELQGDPSAPMCGFSNMACQILNAYGEEPLTLQQLGTLVRVSPLRILLL